MHRVHCSHNKCTNFPQPLFLIGLQLILPYLYLNECNGTKFFDSLEIQNIFVNPADKNSLCYVCEHVCTHGYVAGVDVIRAGVVLQVRQLHSGGIIWKTETFIEHVISVTHRKSDSS